MKKPRAYAAIELLGVNLYPTCNAIPEEVVAVTPSLERPELLSPAVVLRVYLLPMKATVGVPAVNCAS